MLLGTVVKEEDSIFIARENYFKPIIVNIFYSVQFLCREELTHIVPKITNSRARVGSAWDGYELIKLEELGVSKILGLSLLIQTSFSPLV